MAMAGDFCWRRVSLLVSASAIVTGCSTTGSADLSSHALPKLPPPSPVAPPPPAPAPEPPRPVVPPPIPVPDHKPVVQPADPMPPADDGRPRMRPRQRDGSINPLDWRDHVGRAVKIELPKDKIEEGSRFDVFVSVSVRAFAKAMGMQDAEYNATREISAAPNLKVELTASREFEAPSLEGSATRRFVGDKLVWRWSLTAKGDSKGTGRLSVRVKPAITGEMDIDSGDPESRTVEIFARPFLPPELKVPSLIPEAVAAPASSPERPLAPNPDAPEVHRGDSELEMALVKYGPWILGSIIMPLAGYFGKRWFEAREAGGGKPKLRSKRRAQA